MSGEADIGYHDAIRQIQRTIHRRIKVLQSDMKETQSSDQKELAIRVAELEHMLQVIESLHR